MKHKIIATVLLACFAVVLEGGQRTPKVTKPVPVVPEQADAKQVEKKAKVVDPDPQVEETDSVLPLTYVKNKVDGMTAGTKAYVAAECVKCDSKRRAWLNPNDVYGTRNEGRVVMITKDEVGYHITLERVDHQWVCQELPSGVKWIPVKSITSK